MKAKTVVTGDTFIRKGWSGPRSPSLRLGGGGPGGFHWTVRVRMSLVWRACAGVRPQDGVT